jgi:hypothetical protein
VADNYTVVSQRRTVQVLSPTQVADVEEVGFVTHPTGIYAQREVPYQAWAAEGAGSWIGTLATAIENLISGGLATTAMFVQDVDTTGLLTDYLDFTVSYTPSSGPGLPMTTTVRVPVNALTQDQSFGGAIDTYFGGSASPTTDPAQALRDAYDALQATAGL